MRESLRLGSSFGRGSGRSNNRPDLVLSKGVSSMTRLELEGWRSRLAGPLAAALVSLAVGCNGNIEGAEGPSETLRAYALALEEGRADDAYRLLSNEAKRSVSLEAFRRMVKENPEDVKDIALALSRPGGDPVVTATVSAPGGNTLELIYEDGRWTIDGTGVDRYGQVTPRQALMGFLLAYERKRYDVLMRYAPNAEREGRDELMWGGSTEGTTGALTQEMLKKSWEGEQKEEVSRKVQAIRSALPTAKIEQTEDRAAMPYGAGGTVLLKREDGLWKIEEL